MAHWKDNPDGWDLGNVTVDPTKVTCPKCRPANPMTSNPPLDALRAAVARGVEAGLEVVELTPAEAEASLEEYRRNFGESERDAAVRDTNHVLELQSRKGDS